MYPCRFFLQFWLPTWLPEGGVLQVTFSRFFERWAVLGPKWLPGLPQEPPGPPQASICTDFCRILDRFLGYFQTTWRPKNRGGEPKKGQHSVLFFKHFWWEKRRHSTDFWVTWAKKGQHSVLCFLTFLVRKAQAQYRILNDLGTPRATGDAQTHRQPVTHREPQANNNTERTLIGHGGGKAEGKWIYIFVYLYIYMYIYI